MEEETPVTITREFALDAGHRLSKHEFKCQNFHGHRYQFEVTIEGVPSEDLGYVIDFSNVKAPVMDAFDHNFILNEADPVFDYDDGQSPVDVIERLQEKEFYLMPDEPTAENIALESVALIWDAMSEAERKNVLYMTVELWETPNCKVTRRVVSEGGAQDYEVV